MDRNVGQATDSTGAVHEIPDTIVEDAKIKRYQRRMARQQKGSNRYRGAAGKPRKLHRKRARRRDTAHTVVLEGLNTKAMTKSAKGTVEDPGRNVKQKANLNRAILAYRLGTAGAQAGVQGRPGGVCGPSLHFASLQPFRAHRRVKPTVAGGVPMWSLRVPGECRPQCGAQHPGAGGTGAAARRGALPPWSVARPTTGPPATREPDMHGVNHRI